MAKGRFNIRYGTINHYLSQFFHLCLGRVERGPILQRYLPVDIVLSGHAHWKLEFRLAWNQKESRPEIYYGDFSKNSSQLKEEFDSQRPFLFQTPAVGPCEEFAKEPPYFRFIEIDDRGNVITATVLALSEHGTPYVPLLG